MCRSVSPFQRARSHRLNATHFVCLGGSIQEMEGHLFPSILLRYERGRLYEEPRGLG